MTPENEVDLALKKREEHDHKHEEVVRAVRPSLQKRRDAYVRAIRRKAARHMTVEENQRLTAEAIRVVTETEVL